MIRFSDEVKHNFFVVKESAMSDYAETRLDPHLEFKQILLDGRTRSQKFSDVNLLIVHFFFCRIF